MTPDRLKRLAALTRALEAQDESLEFEQYIVDAMGVGVNVVRTDDMTIAFVNQQFATLFGYDDPAELVGRPVHEINADSTPAEQFEIRDQIVAHLAEHEHWDGKVHNRQRDGSLFWTRAVVTTFVHPTYGRVIVALQTLAEET